MTNEEHLKACGWKHITETLWNAPAGSALENGTLYDERDAVEAQIDEDRARYNFVRERSAERNGLLVAHGPERQR